MPLVIDGNNLLHAAHRVESSGSDLDRSGLCETIDQWAQRCGQEVHIVFDGPAPPRRAGRRAPSPSVHVSYSGAGASADEVVIRILQTDSAARRLVVVSSDRVIIRAARRRRARWIRCEDFWARVRRDLARPIRKRLEPEEKEAGLSPEAAQRWLEEFGLN